MIADALKMLPIVFYCLFADSFRDLCCYEPGNHIVQGKHFTRHHNTLFVCHFQTPCLSSKRGELKGAKPTSNRNPLRQQKYPPKGGYFTGAPARIRTPAKPPLRGMLRLRSAPRCSAQKMLRILVSVGSNPTGTKKRGARGGEAHLESESFAPAKIPAKRRVFLLVLQRGFEPRTPCLKGSHPPSPQTRMKSGFFAFLAGDLQQICNSTP